MSAAMRLDRVLVYLRFARTRSRARAMIEDRPFRLNRAPVRRACTEVHPGDVLTFVHGREVRIIELLSLPERRGPPAIARSHYRELDRTGKLPLAAQLHQDLQGDPAT